MARMFNDSSGVRVVLTPHGGSKKQIQQYLLAPQPSDLHQLSNPSTRCIFFGFPR